jgi:hypothetical protein
MAGMRYVMAVDVAEHCVGRAALSRYLARRLPAAAPDRGRKPVRGRLERGGGGMSRDEQREEDGDLSGADAVGRVDVSIDG